MKYHKFYTFCLNFMEIDGKAGGFCGGRASSATPRTASRRRASPCPAARAAGYPAPHRAALFAGTPAPSPTAHAAKIGLSRRSGTSHPAGNFAPSPAAHADFFFIGLSGVCLAG